METGAERVEVERVGVGLIQAFGPCKCGLAAGPRASPEADIRHAFGAKAVGFCIVAAIPGDSVGHAFGAKDAECWYEGLIVLGRCRIPGSLLWL